MTLIRDGFQSADLDAPVVLPTLNLDFANSQSLDERITFSRGSIGTRVNANGLIETIDANQPRFDFDPISGECKGLLIEESRANLLKYSNSFSTGGAGNWILAGASAAVFTQNQTGPDGTSNSAWTIDDNFAGFDGAAFEQAVSITPSTTTNYCLSIFAKKGNSPFFDFYVFFTGSSTKGSYFSYNFDTDTISRSSADGGGISPTIFGKIQYPNGWYRLYFVVNDANSGLNNTLQFRIYPGSRFAGRTGNTLFYGAQLEVGAFPTTYIPTGAATVTRSADNASMTGTNFSSWYNSSEGSVHSSVNFIENLSSSNFWSNNIIYGINDNSTNNRITLFGLSGFKSIVSRYVISGFFYSSPAIIINSRQNKFAHSFKTTGISLVGNGGASLGAPSTTQTITSTYPVVNKLEIGNQIGTFYLNGTISRLAYYPKALSPSQLQYLTQ